MGEDGHWVIIVRRDELEAPIDKWGYRYGELIAEVEECLPAPPEHITPKEIANKLVKTAKDPTLPFVAAIRRCLTILEETRIARSVRLSPGPQLGWSRTYTERQQPDAPSDQDRGMD